MYKRSYLYNIRRYLRSTLKLMMLHSLIIGTYVCIEISLITTFQRNYRGVSLQYHGACTKNVFVNTIRYVDYNVLCYSLTIGHR